MLSPSYNRKKNNSNPVEHYHQTFHHFSPVHLGLTDSHILHDVVYGSSIMAVKITIFEIVIRLYAVDGTEEIEIFVSTNKHLRILSQDLVYY